MNTFWAQITDSNTVDTVFRWARIQENRDWFLPILVVAVLAVYFLRRYRIDAAELRTWQQMILLILRTGAIFALLLFYLHPQWEHLVGSSHVAVLVDTSASMANRDLSPPKEEYAESPQEGEAETSAGPTRLDAVADWIERSELVGKLSEKHDVTLYSFDSTLKQISSDLKPDGEETALGEALYQILQKERGQPLAGVIVLSDGGQNAGRNLDAPLEITQRLRIPIYPIGVGRTRQPLNFRVGNLDVPERAFPGDPFTVKVPIEKVGGEKAEGSETYTVPIELWVEETGNPVAAGSTSTPAVHALGTKIGEKELKFTDAGMIETEFEVRIAEPGKQRLTVKILPPKEDHLPADDLQQADVEVVDRKDRVLLFASAPSRDYQFLCSQIYRDKSMSADVYLPWTKPGVSQNADKILDHFPATRAEMSEYDIVLAFDPNWRELSNEQIDALEFWVARQGGGLILVAGAINQADTVTGWVTDSAMEKIRALYPVEFLAKQSAFDHRYHGGVQAWQLKFSRAGEDADFLKPADNTAEARTFWNEFPGFYGFFAVKGVKPTATLLVSSSSPETLGHAETGALIVEQFYGAGRVLYLGSSELWRLRRVDEKSFEQIATKMLRYVGQGRLQRESDRGSLATDKQRYSLGSIAQLRITANDAQMNPITTPTLPIEVQSPSGTLRMAEVTLDPNLPGTYQAHLPLAEEGAWSIQFTIPDTDEKITRNIQVRMSDLERENPSRNESLLKEIAAKSGGIYYRSPNDALPPMKESSLYGNLNFFASDEETPEEKVQPLTELLKVRSQRAVLDTAIEEKMLRIFLIIICSLLVIEWTLRRLMKLA